VQQAAARHRPGTGSPVVDQTPQRYQHLRASARSSSVLPRALGALVRVREPLRASPYFFRTSEASRPLDQPHVGTRALPALRQAPSLGRFKPLSSAICEPGVAQSLCSFDLRSFRDRSPAPACPNPRLDADHSNTSSERDRTIACGPCIGGPARAARHVLVSIG